MKKILFILLSVLLSASAAMAASFNIDENKDINLTGIQKLVFELKQPNCALCISTGGQSYRFNGGGKNGQLSLSLEGDLKSNNKKAVPSLMTEKNGKVLTVRLYKEGGLFFGLVQSGSVHFNAELPEYFDGTIEILTSSEDLSVKEINTGDLTVKSSSGDIEAAEIEADNIEITASSGDISAKKLAAIDTLTLRASSGDIEVDELLSRSADIHASSGRIKIGKMRAVDEISVLASSGRISAEYLEAEDISLVANSGRISIDELTAEKTLIDSSSGSISVAKLSAGDADIESSSGSTELGIQKLNGDVKIKSSSGNVNISLESKTAFTVDLSASSGKIRSDFKLLGEIDGKKNNEIKGDANGGGHMIRVKASSGSIMIEER